MKFKILILFVIIGVELLVFSHWVSCWIFINNFYFTPNILATTLLNATNADKGVPLLLVRAFHNKILGLLWGILQTSLQYWDIRFLINLLGMVGGIGVYLGIWYFFTKKLRNIYVWILIFLLSVWVFVEMFFIPHIPYFQRLIPFFILLQIFSIFGYFQFIKNADSRVRYAVIVILLLLSLASLFLFPLSYQEFCVKV